MRKQVLEKLIESTELQHREKPVTPEAYQRWSVNGVTRRMMEELELKLIDCLIADAPLDTNDNIARGAVVRQTIKEQIEAILNWKPAELISDED